MLRRGPFVAARAGSPDPPPT
uniref:Uncharacterized protein n=1 Tax=Arundo donax TaxID=35708 RepID=A0A0A9BQZ4_ARUDO